MRRHKCLSSSAVAVYVHRLIGAAVLLFLILSILIPVPLSFKSEPFSA
ncbi:hypothetical protein ABIB90_008198 [Bradyrhizobium sp. JR4.1]